MPFRVEEPEGVDERSVRGRALEVARALAARKAEWVLERLLERPERFGEHGPVVLGADTLVVLLEGPREEILGKPGTLEEARRMLLLLSGRKHQVLTGVAVARPGDRTLVSHEVSDVTFRSLSQGLLDSYLSTGEPLDKAGAYGIQGRGESLVEGFRGCYLNIVGLPLVRAARLLIRAVPGLVSLPGCECGEHSLQRGARGCGSRP